MGKTGRPSKINPKIQAKICDVIRAGNYIETAAAHAGIAKNTLYDWMKRGAREKERIEKAGGRAKVKKSEAEYVEFSDAVEKALADAEVRDVMIIANAATSDWKAAAWRLERKFPDKWGRKDKVQAEVEHSGAITNNHVDLSQLSTEELKKLAELDQE